jgi:hypothetical protein
MNVVRDEDHGQQMQWTDGTYKHPPITIDAILFMSKTPERKECQTQCISSTNT